MKITKKQLRKIIKEEKQRILKEYSDYASWADLHDTLEDEISVFEDIQEKYLFSGWLRENDRFDIDDLLRKAMITLHKVQIAVEEATLESRKTK